MIEWTNEPIALYLRQVTMLATLHDDNNESDVSNIATK